MAKKSITEEFLKDRLDGNTDDIKTGVWYSRFSKIKKYAVDNKLPFVAVWSNGDACSLCKKLEENFMTDTFKNWMKDSGIVFWFGYSGDKLKEDKNGTGKKWAGNCLKYYPFMRFYWVDGKNKVDFAASGNDWNKGRKGDVGAANVITKLESLLAEVEKAGKKLKIRTNPEWSADEIAEFREDIKKNGGYCPCESKKTKDTKCMCKNFREKTDEGDCHCGLYNKYYE